LPTCRHKSKPKDKWAINKAEINQQQQHAQTNKMIEEIKVVTKKAEPEASAISNADNTSVNTVGWAGAHYQMFQSLNMRDEVLLDTASSTSLFGNKEYVAGIEELTRKLELHTNGGPIVFNKTASINKFRKAWYNTDSVANIFSFAEMRKLYRITYNSESEDAFIVHTPKRQVRFKPLKDGLYSLNHKKETHHQTTDGRLRKVSTRQYTQGQQNVFHPKAIEASQNSPRFVSFSGMSIPIEFKRCYLHESHTI
jgi:hypothetical protein